MVFNKKLSSQCNLTAQIEQVQDKIKLYQTRPVFVLSSEIYKIIKCTCTSRHDAEGNRN